MNAGREQRLRQIAERNKAQRSAKTKQFVKKASIALAVLLVLLIAYDRQFVRYSKDEVGEAYINAVNDYFSDNPLRKSQFFFSSEDFKNYIISKHPEVSNVTVSNSILSGSKIVFETKQPAFVWQVNDKTYLGDQDGVIYGEKTPNQSVDPNWPVLRDQAGISVSPGAKVTPSSTLEYIGQVKNDVSNSTDLDVDYFVIPAAAREVHMYLKGKPYFVKLSLDRSVTGQVSELQKSVDYINRSNISVAKYIDLRTQDKAYYQ